jgi:predicted DNA-binding transcriptional regulator AlpA
MPIDIEGVRYLTQGEVLDELAVTRQTLWRWQREGKVPAGQRYRGRQVVFGPGEVEAIREFANRLEPIAGGGTAQLSLFTSPPRANGRKAP